MTTHANQKQERQYYIDWLRILLIISVFLFHIGMIFNTWGWHIKNDQQYGGMLTECYDISAQLENAIAIPPIRCRNIFCTGKKNSGPISV